MLKFNLNPDEKTILVVRKHWIAIVGQLAVYVIASLVPLILSGVLPFFITDLLSLQTTKFIYLFTFAYAFWLMVLWLLSFFAWTTYHLDVWVVTTHRIFLVDQRGMFNREISSLTLDKIQDLTIDIEGFLPTMLKFGDILVETAGEHKSFGFTNARDPEAIKIAINNVQKEFYRRPQPVTHVENAPVDGM